MTGDKQQTTAQQTITHRPLNSHKKERSESYEAARKLNVWKWAIDLVTTVYKSNASFPSHERFGLTSQIRHAAVSIPANIKEGAARDSQKEFTYFLSNAQGSASELETELLIAHKLGYLEAKIYAALRKDIDSIGRMIRGLSQSIKRRKT